MKAYQASIKTAYVHLGISMINNRLAAIDFIESDNEISPADEATLNVCNQIRKYLQDSKAGDPLDIPCTLAGTVFQQKVWNALKKIPGGTVVTYGELANKLGTSARAVGNACRKNPIPLVVPCHRVVSSSGIGGYAGDTSGDLVKFKSWLLQHEGSVLN